MSSLHSRLVSPPQETKFEHGMLLTSHYNCSNCRTLHPMADRVIQTQSGKYSATKAAWPQFLKLQNSYKSTIRASATTLPGWGWCWLGSLTCPQGAILGLSELVPHGDDDADGSEDEDEGHVGDLWLRAAVEAVVEPRHKRTHRQQGDAAVVQSVTDVSLRSSGCDNI